MHKVGKLNAAAVGVLAAAVIPLIASSGAWAAPILGLTTTLLDGSSPALIAGSSSQTFQVHITDSPAELTKGSNFWVQIDDDAPGVGQAAPVITNINMTSGTIFSSDNTGENFDPGTFLGPDGLFGTDDVITNGVTTVSDAGVLATVTLDTTGWLPGQTFTVSFFNVDDGNPTELLKPDSTDYPLAGPGDGTTPEVTVHLISSEVPEPASLGLMAVGASALLLGRRRRVVSKTN